MSLSFLLRSLLPTWRFFEDVGPVAALSYRSGIALESLGPWSAFSEKRSSRHFGSLFLNSEGNLRLAEHALVERLLQDDHVQDSKNTEKVSYQLVKNLVQTHVPNGFHFQFRITLGRDEMDEVLVSSVHGPFERAVK
jgi:hypothetical protein